VERLRTAFLVAAGFLACLAAGTAAFLTAAFGAVLAFGVVFMVLMDGGFE
jgi:hypothetical protein